MSENIVSLSSYRKTLDHVDKNPVNLAGSALQIYRRDNQVKSLVEKIKANGGWFIGAYGKRYELNENSIYGFDASEAWRDLAPLRAGSEEYIDANHQKVHFVVTAHYPLYGSTVYFNHVKKKGMYHCQVFVYQDSETVPTFQMSSWFEDFKSALSFLNGVVDKALEQVLSELKSKYNMSLIDFESTKDIHYRKYKKKNQHELSRKRS